MPLIDIPVFAGAVLADLGQAKALDANASHITSSHVRGTSGYTCPDFQDTGRVSPRLDVFAFGVIALEVLTGKPACDVSCAVPLLSARVNIHVAQRKPLVGLLDVMAGWSAEGARELVDLARSCLRRINYEDPDGPGRPEMPHVLAELMRIRAERVPGPGLPAVAMETEIVAPSRRAPPAPVMAVCCICGDSKPARKGLFCDPRYVARARRVVPKNAHFVCGSGAESCLEQYLAVKCTQGEAGGVDVGGALRCPGGSCPRELQPQRFGPLVSEGAFAAFTAAQERRVTRLSIAARNKEVKKKLDRARVRIRAEVEAEVAIGGASAAAEMQLAEAAAQNVRNEVLTLHGPCGHAFFDFDGCFSVQCAACGIYFCAWCLGGATADRQASHHHVGRCPANTNEPYDDGRKSYFGTLDQFNAAHRERRLAEVSAFLGRLRGGASVRRLAARLLARDLADLGIRLPANVTAVGEDAGAGNAAGGDVILMIDDAHEAPRPADGMARPRPAAAVQREATAEAAKIHEGDEVGLTLLGNLSLLSWCLCPIYGVFIHPSAFCILNRWCTTADGPSVIYGGRTSELGLVPLWLRVPLPPAHFSSLTLIHALSSPPPLHLAILQLSKD